MDKHLEAAIAAARNGSVDLALADAVTLTERESRSSPPRCAASTNESVTNLTLRARGGNLHLCIC